MTRGLLEVADIFRRHGEAFLARFPQTTGQQRRVLEAVRDCRTAALGGHLQRCDEDGCAHEEISYNSCRDRHCPKCQSTRRKAWLNARQAQLLPDIPYFHVVFTLPDELGPLARRNKRRLYTLFFRAAAGTLRDIGRDPKHLGAELGFFAVLHTWGQKLDYHPHIHCVIPGGGLSADRSRWIACPENFFLPVRVLSRRCRTRLLGDLQKARDQGQLTFTGPAHDLAGIPAWNDFLNALKKKEWVVYAKPPFGGPLSVLKYLARYVHRVAVANSRLVALHDGRVTLRWKDYARGHQSRLLRLEAVEFIRRFLQHVFPKGFVHIRHYGFLSNRVREKELVRCRQLLGQEAALTAPAETVSKPSADEPQEVDRSQLCPVCKTGRMRVVRMILRTRRPALVEVRDTS